MNALPGESDHRASGPDVFVGRAALLAEVLSGFGGRDEVPVDHVKGLSGAGKTAFLRRLHDLTPGHLRVIPIDIQPYSPPDRGDKGTSVAAISSSFQSFEDLVKSLTSVLRPELEQELADECQRARNSVSAARLPELTIEQHITLEEGAQLTSSPQSIAVELRPEYLADLWRKAAARVADVFVTMVSADATEQAFVLLVDNVDQCSDSEFGVWFHDLLRRLRFAAVVMTCDAASLAPLGRGREQRMPNLTRDEVGEYLAVRTGVPCQAEVVDRVHAFSGGHPAALGLVHDLVFQDGVADLSTIDGKLLNLPSDPSERLAVLVEGMVARLDDHELGTALKALSIPRRAGSPLLAAMLDDEGMDVPRALRQLEVFSFIEQAQDGGPFALRVHDFVRAELNKRWRRYDPDGFRLMHQRAADYYYDQIVDEDQGPGYGTWFQYEDAAWRRDRREWLYHLGHLGDAEEIRLRIARVFCDAMWWWGSYVHLDFCDEVVADVRTLAEVTGSPRFDDLAAAFALVLEHYPVGSIKPADANWKAVRSAFQRIRDFCGLRDADALGTEEQRHVAGVINIFIADSWRYPTPHLPRASQHYAAARDLFRRNEDRWNVAWITFEEADYTFDQGDLPGAWARSIDAASRTYEAAAAELQNGSKGYVDDELIANIHRLRGSCSWALGDEPAAAQSLGLAVLHAYLFHPTGGPPDEYTHQFYVEMRGRAITPAVHLWQRGRRAEALEFCNRLRAVMAEAWEPPDVDLEEKLATGGHVELALALFPRGPEPAELGLDTSDFMNDWRDIDDGLGPGVRTDLVVGAVGA